MIIRRKALEDTGILDENYFMYVEDLDICYRMWQKNWEVYYYPEAEIMHHIAGSSGSGEIKASFRMQKSVFYFFWKNYRRSWKIILIPLLVLTLGFRLFLTIIKSPFSGQR
jgi:GT2 family glycosyltransferase